VTGIFSFLIGIGAVLYADGAIAVGIREIFFGIFCGIAMSYLSDLCYYISLRDGHADNVAAVFSTQPIFALIVGVALLGEHVTFLQIIGIFLIIGGTLAYTVSWTQHHLNGRIPPAAVVFAVGAAVIGYLTKLTTTQASLVHVLLWIGIGQLIASLFIVATHSFDVRVFRHRSFKRGLVYLIGSNAVNIISVLAILTAYTRGPISLILPLQETKLMFLFIIPLLLGKIAPKFLNERITRPEIIRKSFASIVIMFGTLLLIVI
jgi:uncharacterized membrane protein